ncbi:6-hydroxymethylpterin diphosphokinase MptE-like protein [Lysinibacillus fusiformis]|uniref:6-hydroxymethylpterin diphosphokinase MptE-like protein n=1 Tax=Lysinibacillus fusiformis TaxID=28031 RepID=UPI0038248FE6
MQEAERFIDSLKEKIEESEHIVFYGVGLGYHIRYFCEQFPEKLVSAYEPVAEIANLCLKLQSKTTFPKEKLAHFLVEGNEDLLQENLQKLRELVHQKFTIITLPVYERLFPEQIDYFNQSFKQFLIMTGNDIATVMEFSQRWTINSIKNLQYIVESQSIFEKKAFFKGKPAIIVSAGPSLNEELANLKYIKENGLAYIFAVGSATKVLIDNSIFPDAVCTYDPQQHNYRLFEEIYKNRIKSIPMIYATTVGHETLDQYSGPLFSFITTQDNLTLQLLEKQQKSVIYDAPSIAVITLQLLNVLEVSKIILVGQNFAFKQNKFYADGIERYDKEKRGYLDNTVQQQDKATIIEVEDVHNRKVSTNAHFQQMKADMEIVLKLTQVPTINTTQGGAKIEGTNFKSLRAVIEEELDQKVVNEQWYQTSVEKQKLNGKILNQLEKECSTYMSVFNEMESILKQLAGNLKVISSEQPINTLQKFEGLLHDMQNTSLSKLILNPILKMDNEKLIAKLKVSNKKVSIEERLKDLLEHYQTYLDTVLVTYKKVIPILQTHIFLKMNSDQRLKFYEATCGVFQFEGKWEKKWLELQENENSPTEIHAVGVITKQQGSTVEFKFRGTSLQIIGTNHSEKSLEMQITIDGKEQIITIGRNTEKSDLIQSQALFEVTKLTNKMHEVKVEVISEDPNFKLLGIKINQDGQVYHIHEVEKMEDLKVGKRIRYHYEASLGAVGEFSKSEVNTSSFLPLTGSKEPNGDFYFIMVDENEGEKILYADRNVQHSISWDTVNNANIKIVDNGYCYPIFLPFGGNAYCDETGEKSLINRKLGIWPKSNEWDCYIMNNAKDNMDEWNINYMFSWCEETPENNLGGFMDNGFRRITRGYLKRDSEYSNFSFNASYLTVNWIGYRPVLKSLKER